MSSFPHEASAIHSPEVIDTRKKKIQPSQSEIQYLL